MSPRERIPKYPWPSKRDEPRDHEWRSGGARNSRAGFWRRFAAALIDGLLLGLGVTLLTLAFKQGGYLVGLLASVVYYVYLEGGPTGQTLGKSAMGIRVVDIDTGGPIGYGRGFVRYVGRIVSAAAFYLGYLWMLWDPEKQTWHDKFARDLVVPADAYPRA